MEDNIAKIIKDKLNKYSIANYDRLDDKEKERIYKIELFIYIRIMKCDVI